MINEEDAFIEYDNQSESEEDITELDQSFFSQAVVSATDWTTETIINQINKGNIQLNPDFQRRDAWDKKRKSRFIESLILGLPVPQIVLAESIDRRGSYIVLDGKQRLLSIRQFAAERDDNVYVQLKLSSLDIRNDLKGKSLVALREDLDLFDDLSAFENQPIRTVVIKNWPNENFLYHVFLRLNTGSVPLSPQELRQALHPGPFISFLDEASSGSAALQDILKLKKPDFRMRDAELLLRYFSFKNYLSMYSGTLKSFLDYCCSTMNQEWGELEENTFQQMAEFEEAHLSIKRIFANNAYKKWIGDTYESRFNRSIFDVLILSFSESTVRELSDGKELAIEEAFKELCINPDFKASIESTTKSLTATHTRISLWNTKLNEILGSSLHVPKLVEHRII
ncbi:DUF262 domain-containing protein [Sulfurimonas sp. HSL1-2]|uniref:DUF262 domain-containing protein n=1 Tax=Thiomicrolovo zhangzhouensis TaxID=3131933 RepID=UPI0031FA44DB